MNFTFGTAGQVVFGRGESARAGEAVARFGRRVLLVTGAAALARAGALARIEESLARAGADWVHWTVSGEPDVALVDEGARLSREHGCDAVLAVGGGAVMDAGKAVAALAVGGGGALDYLEDVPGGAGRAVTVPPLPLVCVPTTAGTGSEVTRNAVIGVPGHAVKRSMRSDLMLPRVAIVDPDLPAAAPLPVAAAAGLDALTQLLEAYVCRNAQPMTDALALAGLPRAIGALRAMAGGQAGPAAWEDMALAALYSGMCLANAGLGAAHGLAAPLGGRYPVPHGVACACLLPATMRANVIALRQRAPGSPALGRYAAAAALIVADSEPSPERAAAELDDLRRRLGVPPLGAYGVTAAGFGPVIAGARGSSMRANPVELTDAELAQILADALAG